MGNARSCVRVRNGAISRNRDRHIGCVELLDFYLARAERHNPALNAIVWQVDQARERAHAADIDAVIADSADLIAAHGLDLETVRDVLAQDLAGAG
jgi:Asp-tRNA(Asn)/Glu-tRNA(Gln) amidotransferase A subunit family amidase